LPGNNGSRVIFNGNYLVNGTSPVAYIVDTDKDQTFGWNANMTSKYVKLSNFTSMMPSLLRNQNTNVYNYYTNNLTMVSYNSTSFPLLYAFQTISLLDMAAFLMEDTQNNLLYRYSVFIRDN
jgi:hypothetical protein